MVAKTKIELNSAERIIAAATKLFVTKGLDGTKMRSISAEAEVNSAMIYYYFHSKQELFTLVFDNAVDKFMLSMNYFERRDLNIFEKIELLCNEIIKIQIANPYLSFFLINEIAKDPVRLKNELLLRQKEKIDLFSREIKKSIKNKVIRKVDPIHLFINITSLCIFPFITRPIFTKLEKLSEEMIYEFTQKQQREIKNMLIPINKKAAYE